MHKFRNSIWAFLAATALLCTSCFDITEEYRFHNDGSGTATYIIDMSQMMELMGSLGDMGGGETGGEDPLKSINEMFADNSMTEKLASLEGITNVKNLSNKDAAVIGYAFDFKDIAALNRAITQRDGDGELFSNLGMEGGMGGGENCVNLAGKKFNRKHPADTMEKPSEEDSESMGMAAMMFAEAFYTIRYTFDKNVKKTTMPGGKVLEDGKTVEVKKGLMDIVKGEAKFGGDIKLK